MRTCEIEGCDKKHRSHGLCAMHLHRVQRHGDPNTVKKPTPRNSDRKCSIEGCGRKHCAGDLCEMHYARRWRSDTKQIGRQAQCDYPGCAEQQHRYGLCKRHDAELADAPFYDPPRRKAKLPVVGWDEMQESLRSRVRLADTTLTLDEVMAARMMRRCPLCRRWTANKGLCGDCQAMHSGQ